MNITATPCRHGSFLGRKAQLAKEVYDQKKAELDRVRELMLLAYQRMGEITREMPKAAGRPSEKILPSSGKNFIKPKSEVIQDLGFSTSQVGRMEQLATHPDIVEEVIAESQAGQTEATQGEVLRRIKEREKVPARCSLLGKQLDQFQKQPDSLLPLLWR